MKTAWLPSSVKQRKGEDNMGNLYLETKKKNEELMNKTFEGTVFFAFSDKQFEEGMKKIGAKDSSELYKLGCGGFYKKTDSEKIHQMYVDMEANEAKALEEGGEEYAYQMFACELADHEFDYTMEIEDTLDALAYEPEEIGKNPVLYAGLERALQKYGVTPGCFGIEKEVA